MINSYRSSLGCQLKGGGKDSRAARVDPALPVGRAVEESRVSGDDDGYVAVVGEGQREVGVFDCLHTYSLDLRRKCHSVSTMRSASEA